MSSNSANGSSLKFFDIVLKILSALVLPLMIWGVRLEVKNAILEERLSEVQEDIAKLAPITENVTRNTMTLVRLEGKLDNLDEKIDELKKLLRRD